MATALSVLESFIGQIYLVVVSLGFKKVKEFNLYFEHSNYCVIGARS
jgi:hypothetical protein